jgi:hypothetical protein
VGHSLVTVQNDVITFRNDAFEVDVLARIFLGHTFEVFNKGPLAISHMRVVLGVGCACIQVNCFSWPTLVEHQVIKSHDILLVTFKCGFVHASLLLHPIVSILLSCLQASCM